MKSQPKLNVKRVRQFISTTFMLLLLSLFAAGSAQAKKPQPDPGPSAANNSVFWGGSNSDVLEGSSRMCAISQIAPDESSGKFLCQQTDSRIMYDFSNMISEPIHRRGDDWRCANPMWFYLVPDMEYSFSWNGDCTAGCGVTVVNAFSNTGTIGGSVGRMTIEGFATATTAAGANPFAVPESLAVDYLHVTLFGVKGNDKVLAVCKLTPRSSNPVKFVTSPVPIIQ